MRRPAILLALTFALVGCPKRTPPMDARDVRAWPDLVAGWKARVEKGLGSAEAMAAWQRAMDAIESPEAGTGRIAHRELQACIAAAKKDQDEWGQYVCAIKDADYVDDSRDRPEARRSLEEVDKSLERSGEFGAVRGHLKGSMARLDRLDCRFADARKNVELALRSLKLWLGAKDPELAPVLALQAIVQKHAEKNVSAAEAADRALAIKSRELGKQSPELAGWLRFRGDIVEGPQRLADYHRAIELVEKSEGRDSLRATEERLRLASFNLERAEITSPQIKVDGTTIEKALAVRKRLLPDRDDWIALAFRLKSELSEQAGDLEGAELFARKAIDAATLLDEDPCDVAARRRRLGRILAVTGRRAEALPLLSGGGCDECRSAFQESRTAAFVRWVGQEPRPDEPLMLEWSLLPQRARVIVAPRYPTPVVRGEKVRLLLTIGTDGNVESVEALAGGGQFLANSLHAAKQWKFRPVFIAGKPVRWSTLINFNFRIRGED